MKTEVKVYIDNELEGGFAAYITDMKGNNKILVNVEALFEVTENTKEFKEALIQVIQHEVGHHLEEILNLEFDEERIDKIRL
jgi:predicted Zn-dependent protease with MMP-like domain